MDNTQLITQFYSSFSEGNIEGMLDCYHSDIVFQDAVFGQLTGERARNMWKMLLSNKKADTKITFKDVVATSVTGEANWVAEYVYGAKKRKVVNTVHAEFQFKDGKIINHRDTFDLWKWSNQAFGIAGTLLGWTSFMKNKIQVTANKSLDVYIEKNRTA